MAAPVLDHASAPPELYFFGCREAAKRAGFNLGRHRQFPTWRAWCPGDPVDHVAAIEPWRVVVVDFRRQTLSPRLEAEFIEALKMASMRQRRWGGSAVWMDL